jgi:hypothetical protein
MTGAEIRQ